MTYMQVNMAYQVTMIMIGVLDTPIEETAGRSRTSVDFIKRQRQ